MDIPQYAQDTINHIIKEDEGGWVFTDNVNDPGGMTYGGMTYQTFSGVNTYLSQYFKRDALVGSEELQEQVVEAYFKIFYNPIQQVLDRYTWPIDAAVSCAVNLGLGDVWAVCQNVVNEIHETKIISVDGKLGERTRQAIIDIHPDHPVVPLFCHFWEMRYIDLCTQNMAAWENYTGVLEMALKTNTPVPAHLETKPKYKRWKDLQGWLNRVDRYRTNAAV